MTRWLLLLLALPLLVQAGLDDEDDNNLVVKLATQKKLMPLYLAPMRGDGPKNMQNQLQRVLAFDLANNGMTEVASSTTESDSVATKEPFDSFTNISHWQNKGFFYVVKAQVKDEQLSARVLHVPSGQGKRIDNLPLTGDISHDRRQVHRLADAIYKVLFNEDGIASTRILFTRRTPKSPTEWDSEIWEMDYDGGNPRQLTRLNGYTVTPAYIPPPPGQQASQYVYVNYKAGQPKVYIGNLRDTSTKPLIRLQGNQLMPTVSRQRNQIAFICDYTGNPDLFLQEFTLKEGAVSKPRQIFTHRHATQGTPSFSPDGKQIAFVSNKDGTAKIYTMPVPAPGAKVSSLKPQLITKFQRGCTAPNWSPDGRKIAYCVKTKGVRQIWVYDFDKGEEFQVTNGNENKENPFFAPNSNHLVYNTSGIAQAEMYIINLNQLKPIKISTGRGEKRFPSWEPR